MHRPVWNQKGEINKQRLRKRERGRERESERERWHEWKMVRQAIQYILRGSLMSANRINEDNYICFNMLKYRDNYKCIHKVTGY